VDPVAQAAGLLGSDPAQAARILRPLADAQPGDPGIQGTLLAAQYRTHNAQDFLQGFRNARSHGAGLDRLLKVPAFRSVILEERDLQKRKAPGRVLTVDQFNALVEGP
jgi:hypothetical protein